MRCALKHILMSDMIIKCIIQDRSRPNSIWALKDGCLTNEPHLWFALRLGSNCLGDAHHTHSFIVVMHFIHTFLSSHNVAYNAYTRPDEYVVCIAIDCKVRWGRGKHPVFTDIYEWRKIVSYCGNCKTGIF